MRSKPRQVPDYIRRLADLYRVRASRRTPQERMGYRYNADRLRIVLRLHDYQKN